MIKLEHPVKGIVNLVIDSQSPPSSLILSVYFRAFSELGPHMSKTTNLGNKWKNV